MPGRLDIDEDADGHYRYAPGVRVVVDSTVTAGTTRLDSIHAVRILQGASKVPEIDGNTLESHRSSGPSTIFVRDLPEEVVTLGICIDTKGRVTSASDTSRFSSAYADAVIAAAKKWTFKPFVVRGKAVPVCATQTHRNVMPPPVPPLPIIVGSGELESLRMSGTPRIEPNDDAKRAIVEAKKASLTASFKVCVDEHGRVASVDQVRSSGVRDYDDQLWLAIGQWTFTPYLVNERPMPVCAATTFNYTRR